MVNLNEKLDLDRKTLSIKELGQIAGARSVVDPLRCNEERFYLMVEINRGRCSTQGEQRHARPRTSGIHEGVPVVRGHDGASAYREN